MLVVFRKEKCATSRLLKKREFSSLWSFKLNVQWNNLVGDKSLDIIVRKPNKPIVEQFCDTDLTKLT